MPALSNPLMEPGQAERLSLGAPDREMDAPSTQPTPQQAAVGDLLLDNAATPQAEQ